MLFSIRSMFLCGFVGLFLFAWEANGQDKAPAVKAAEIGDFLVTVRPTKKVFSTNERLSFEITFQNDSKKTIKFGVTDFLGSQNVGLYQVSIQNLKTKVVWKVGRDPNAVLPGAPARLLFVELDPGQKKKTKFLIPHIGQRFWHGGTEKNPQVATRQLPAGDYALTIEMQLNKVKGKTVPAEFEVK